MDTTAPREPRPGGEAAGAGRGTDAVTVEAIAREAGVGKQTIYRWWPSRSALVLDALVQDSLEATPMPTTDDLQADLTTHLRSVVRLFRSPAGALLRDVLGLAQRDPVVARELRERYWEPRREVSRERLQRAVADGTVRADLDPAVALDVLYGALWTRLVVGHAPLDDDLAGSVVTAAWGSWAP